MSVVPEPQIGATETSGTARGSADPSVLAAVEAMRRHNPKADPLSRLPDVHPGRIPNHIAVIMDGNGRWAQERGFPREFGHRNGAIAVRTILEECELLGVRFLTLYSFSLENWKRPDREIQALMELCVAYCDGEREALLKRNVRCKVIGRREGLPAEVLGAIDRLVQGTASCTGATLCLAINYGSRAEIADAARALARDVASGKLEPDRIDEQAVASRLYTAGLPDPDLLIRTGGDFRVSNYLLWQISYSEIHVTPTYWPDFGVPELYQAIREYAGRSRRYGGLDQG